MNTQLIGRDIDVSYLIDDVLVGRCVTVFGPAGLGKSALVQAFAADWPGPVTVLDLHRGGAGSIEALAAAPPRAGSLVVLDGLTGPWPEERQAVTQLLAADCAVLATGRDLLGVAGEQAIALAPLRRGTGDTDEDCPAFALFVQRIEEAGGDLTDPVAGRALVDLLDGVPGAIEVVATHVAARGIDTVLAGVRAQFELKVQRGERIVRSLILDLVRNWVAQTSLA